MNVKQKWHARTHCTWENWDFHVPRAKNMLIFITVERKAKNCLSNNLIFSFITSRHIEGKLNTCLYEQRENPLFQLHSFCKRPCFRAFSRVSVRFVIWKKKWRDCDGGIPLCRKVDQQLSSETLNHEMPPFRRRHLGWILWGTTETKSIR